jgi:hypothetical protein
MNTLWAYGTCLTKYLKDNFTFWPEIVAKKIKYNVVNNGQGGCSNVFLRNSLIADLSKIKENDIVVFQFTYNLCQINYFDYNENMHTLKFHNTYELFKKESKYYSNKDYELWERFSDRFYSELILRDYYNLVEIFNYIEKHLKAKVRFFFFLRYHKVFNESILYRIIKDKRVVLFQDKSISPKFGKNETLTTDDRHPNQQGHVYMSKYILNAISIDTKYNLLI